MDTRTDGESWSTFSRHRRARRTRECSGIAARSGYNALGQFATIQRFANTNNKLVATSAYAYDAADRLTSLRHTRKNNKTIARYAFTHDAAGRMTSFTTPDGASNYSFDDTNQLTGADHSYQRDENYSYSGNGNRANPGYD